MAFFLAQTHDLLEYSFDEGDAATLRQRHLMTSGISIDARARQETEPSPHPDVGRAAQTRSGQRAKRPFALCTLTFCAALSLGACSPESPQVGSQTNWLAACDDSSECGDSYCICGTCTAPCTEDAACSELPGSECVTSDETGVVALCSGHLGPSGMCLPRCDDGPCPAGTACTAGVCISEGNASTELTLDLTLRHQSLIGFGAG